MEVSTFMFSTGLSNLLHAIAFLWPQLEVAPSTLRFKQYYTVAERVWYFASCAVAVTTFSFFSASQWQWRHFASCPVAMTTFCQLPSGNDDNLPAAQWQWRHFARCPMAMTTFFQLPSGNDDILPFPLCLKSICTVPYMHIPIQYASPNMQWWIALKIRRYKKKFVCTRYSKSPFCEA